MHIVFRLYLKEKLLRVCISKVSHLGCIISGCSVSNVVYGDALSQLHNVNPFQYAPHRDECHSDMRKLCSHFDQRILNQYLLGNLVVEAFHASKWPWTSPFLIPAAVVSRKY